MIRYFEKLTKEALDAAEHALTPAQKAEIREKVEEIASGLDFSSYDALLVFQDGLKKGLLAARFEKGQVDMVAETSVP